MINDGKGGKQIKGKAGGGVDMADGDPKELEFIMSHPDGHVENETL